MKYNTNESTNGDRYILLAWGSNQFGELSLNDSSKPHEDKTPKNNLNSNQ